MTRRHNSRVTESSTAWDGHRLLAAVRFCRLRQKRAKHAAAKNAMVASDQGGRNMLNNAISEIGDVRTFFLPSIIGHVRCDFVATAIPWRARVHRRAIGAQSMTRSFQRIKDAPIFGSGTVTWQNTSFVTALLVQAHAAHVSTPHPTAAPVNSEARGRCSRDACRNTARAAKVFRRAAPHCAVLDSRKRGSCADTSTCAEE
eukprot:IDg19889t1